MAGAPALQPRARLGLRRRAGDLDQRHRAAAATRRADGFAGSRRRNLTLAGWRPILAATPRALDASRFSFLLREMGRPGRIPETGRLVLRRELEQGLQCPDRFVAALRRVANPRKALGHRVDGGGLQL